MWITRAAFDALNAERIKATEEARVLAQQNASLQITCDWFRARNEQVERERARLLWQYLGIRVEVPVAVQAQPDAEELVGGNSLFQDIGDAEAKRRKIDWDDSGVVKQ